jgi:lysophospholipase L1-like esterase
MGDSFISGQAGRWQGNSIDASGNRSGTDRACVMKATGCTYDEDTVYLDGSGANNCHRSDVAEIRSSAIPVEARINIACSGAQTADVFRSAFGGQSEKGEAPQADQLAPIARANDVRLIVVSIGGNDLDFAAAVTRCIVGYVGRTGPCRQGEEASMNAAMPKAMAGVGKAIDEIRAVMGDAGYRPWDYDLVLQSYPSPLPRAAENRYPEAGADRGAIGNCPFYDSDSNWARDSAVPLIARNLEAVAAAKSAQFLDLRDALQGREICSKTTTQADPLKPPTPTTSEWARFAGQNSIAQGELDESFHPSAYGQMALGRCLALVFPQSAGSWKCTNTPGRGPEAMALQPVSPTAGRFALRLKASTRRVIAGRRTCLSFTTLSTGVRVERVAVRFAGRARRTSSRGRVRMCLALRAGRHRARATRPGFAPASTTITAVQRRQRAR